MDVLFSQADFNVQPGSQRTPSRSLTGYRYVEVSFTRDNLLNDVTVVIEAQFVPAGPFIEMTRATITPWETDTTLSQEVIGTGDVVGKNSPSAPQGHQTTPTPGVIGFGWRDSNAPRAVQTYVDTPVAFVADVEVRADPIV